VDRHEFKSHLNFEEYVALMQGLGYVKPINMLLDTSDRALVKDLWTQISKESKNELISTENFLEILLCIEGLLIPSALSK
jgi:hypothetical protein